MHHEEVLGRDVQWSRVVDLLTEVTSGDSAALLVDGAPGTGRTTLLRAAVREATNQGVELIAIDDVDVLPKDRHSTLFAATDQPTAWLLTSRGDFSAFTSVTDLPTRRTTLGPLPRSAVDELVTNRLGSTVEPAVLALIAGAGGNPLLLTELLAGLDEGQPPVGTPRRVQELIRRRASPEAWQLLRVGAVLGRSCQVTDLAAMMRQSTAELLPTVDTLLDDGVLAWTDDHLSFSHELVWWAVLDAIPPPVRRALTDDRDRIHPEEWHHPARTETGDAHPAMGSRPAHSHAGSAEGWRDVRAQAGVTHAPAGSADAHPPAGQGPDHCGPVGSGVLAEGARDPRPLAGATRSTVEGRRDGRPPIGAHLDHSPAGSAGGWRGGSDLDHSPVGSAGGQRGGADLDHSSAGFADGWRVDAHLDHSSAGSAGGWRGGSHVDHSPAGSADGWRGGSDLDHSPAGFAEGRCVDAHLDHSPAGSADGWRGGSDLDHPSAGFAEGRRVDAHLDHSPAGTADGWRGGSHVDHPPAGPTDGWRGGSDLDYPPAGLADGWRGSSHLDHPLAGTAGGQRGGSDLDHSSAGSAEGRRVGSRLDHPSTAVESSGDGRQPPGYRHGLLAGGALPADGWRAVPPPAGSHPDHRPAGITACSDHRQLAGTAPTEDCRSAAIDHSPCGCHHPGDEVSRSIVAVRGALARPSPLRHAASLHGLLANLLLLKGDSAAARVAADRVLATPGVGARVADGATAARLVALALGDDPHVEAAAEAALTGSGSTAAIAASFVLSNVWWDKGQLADALRMARHRVDAATAPHWWLWQRLALINKLAQLRRLDEATAMMRATHTAMAELKLQRYEGNRAIVESHVLLLGGRLSAAAERARAGVAAARQVGIPLLTPFGLSVLAAVALRGADLDTAAARLDECGDGVSTPLRTWVSLQLAARQHGPAHAAALAVDTARDSLLVAEPGAAAWLVRTATAAGDNGLAAQYVARAERLAAANPGYPTLSAAATQARAHLVKDESAEPASESVWESLSGVERAIAALVAKGMTNRQIATRVRLSPHTVNYHLRGMFRKLGISSRTELARYVPAA